MARKRLLKEGLVVFRGIRTLPQRFFLLLASFQQDDSLSFSDALTQEQIQSACDQHDVSPSGEDEVFTPSITIWGFLSQVIHKKEHRSCLAAVARIGIMLVALGRPRWAQNNGPYCRARCRLPVGVFEQLTQEVAVYCETEAPEEWLWKGRHVKLIDGTTVTMPDTEENQKAFPQQSCQEEGLGYPIARMVVSISLATAMVCDMSMGPYQGKETGELARLREMLDRFEPGDIALADKLFGAFFMIALLLDKGVDMVTLLHQSRDADAEKRRGQRLGKGDYLITWQRPDRPDWMDEETYAQMP
ncbi:MAG: IS4/IS5 family transposase, partial [Phycisphaerae bacterium]